MLRHPKVAAFLRWLPFIIIAVNLFLVFAGVVNLAQAALLVIFLEVCLFDVVLAEFTAMRIAFRKARSQGATRMQALMSGLDTCLPPVVALVIKQELLVMSAIPRLFRRRSQKTGTTLLRSSGPAPSLSLGILAITVPGCVLCLVFVGGPGWLRWVVFGLCLYFALYALGFRVLYTTTHSVGPEQLRIRHGATVDLTLPLSEVSGVHTSQKLHRGKAVDVTESTLITALFGRTNVVVEFDSPVAVGFFDRDEERVTRIRFFTDVPELAVATIEAHIPSASRASQSSDTQPQRALGTFGSGHGTAFLEGFEEPPSSMCDDKVHLPRVTDGSDTDGP